MSNTIYTNPTDPFIEYKSGSFHDEVRQWILDNPIDFPENGTAEGLPSWNTGIKGIESHCYGKNNPFYGKKHSAEARKKISDAAMGRVSPRKGVKLSPETKKKLSDVNKGKVSPMQGKKHKPESLKKMSEAKKGIVPWNKGLKIICKRDSLGRFI